MEETTAYVYGHRRPDTGQIIYVGKGTHSKQDKYRRAKETRGRNKHWNCVVGKTGFEWEILMDNVSQSDIDELECFVISEIGLENLTNVTEGGTGGDLSRFRDYSNQNIGRKHSEETKKKMSETQLQPYSLKGQSRFLGMNHSNMRYWMRIGKWSF